jgi:hypothetical protein
MQQRAIITAPYVLALMLTTTAVHAEQRCSTRPGVGAQEIITTCTDGSGGPPQQYRTRQGVGGTSITTGAGKTCTTREGVGGRLVTTCR